MTRRTPVIGASSLFSEPSKIESLTHGGNIYIQLVTQTKLLWISTFVMKSKLQPNRSHNHPKFKTVRKVEAGGSDW